MNIQNIKELSEKLESLGLPDLSFALFHRICFKPAQFFLSRKIQEDQDWLNVQLCFKRDNSREEYQLMYYEAILQREMVFTDIVINGINIHALDQQMKEIDWAVSFDPEYRKWNLEDGLNLEQGRRIEKIVEALATLEATQEGKIFATSLKTKYWAGLTDQDLLDGTSPLKSEPEFIQRFYFFERQPGITVSEAHRFLLNKWLEKQMQAKEREIDDNKKKGNKGNGITFQSNSLLKKRRSSPGAKSKITN